jgi:hypothetical protein
VQIIRFLLFYTYKSFIFNHLFVSHSGGRFRSSSNDGVGGHLSEMAVGEVLYTSWQGFVFEVLFIPEGH